MSTSRRLSDAELAEIQRRRPAVRASLACEGMFLSAEEERLNDQMDAERLTVEDRIERIVQFHRTKRNATVPARAIKVAG